MSKKTHNREQRHPFENVPPHQERYSRGDDGWNLRTNAIPLESKKINTLPNNSTAADCGQELHMHPVTYEKDSAYIHESKTRG